MTARLTQVTCSKGLEPFLPLLHAAWADGELSNGELRDLREAIERAPHLDPECREAVGAWLDPENPPSADDIAALAAHIRRHLPKDPGRSIGPMDLGLRLVGSVDAETVAALAAANQAAGPFEPAAAVELVRPLNTPPDALAPLPAPTKPRFDFDELRALLDGSHAGVKDQVRRILSRPEFRIPLGVPTAEYRNQVFEWAKTLAYEGIGGLGMPAQFGGGGDPGGFIAAFGVIAHHDLSLLTKFGVQFGLYAGAVFRLGTEGHHAGLLPGAIDMTIPGCFAMTETGHGSNVANIETTARFDRDTDEFVITTPRDAARKDYIGNAAVHGRRAVVFARLVVDDLDHGVHAFDVPLRNENGALLTGVRIEDVGEKVGLNGVDNGRVWFADVRVPRTALFDRFATLDADGRYDSDIRSPNRRFFTTLGTLVGGRVSVALAGISAAETGLAIAVRYATRRRQFGTTPGAERPILGYRTHQLRLMPRLAATYGYHAALAGLAEEYVASESEPGDGDVDRRRLEARAAGLKAYATWHAIDTLQEARESCGGQGYLAENRIGLLRDDADVFTTFEGDNTVLAQLLVKALLTEYRSSFDDPSPSRLVRYIRSRVSAVLTEAVPVVGSITGGRGDADARGRLLDRRAEVSLETLAMRIRARIDDGTSAADAFLDVQPHVLHAARSTVESWVHRSMRDMAEQADDPELSQLLDTVAALADLWHIHSDVGWFLQHGVLSSAGASDTRDAVIQLSETLAGDARALVDAFGIPNEILAAPIAL